MKRGQRTFAAVLAAVGFVCAGTAAGLSLREKGVTEAGREDAFVRDTGFLPAGRGTVAAAAEMTDDASAAEGFVMQPGAGIRLNEVTGIRFRAWVPDALAEEAAAEGKSFGFVIAPASYFEAATEGSGEECDYIRALAELEAQGASPALRMTCLPVEENGRLMIQGSIVSILYENTNLDFSAVAYVETNSGGEVSYEYAAFAEGDCLTNARSVCYVASAALNDGDREYSEGQKELLRGFVGRGIDLAAGLGEEASAAVASREISVQVSAPSAPLETGERETLSASVTVRYPEDAYPRTAAVPVFWNSSAPEVFAVDRYGIIEAKGDGSAAISACVGEVSASVTAVCENAVYYDCTVSEEGGRGLLNLSPSSFSVRAGESFSVTVAVSDYEGYGEMSFWVGETLYTTADGSVALELTADGDTSFVLASPSSSLDYFTVTGNSVIAGTQRDKTNLPDKLILPRYSEDGELLTEIAQYAFRGSRNTPAARYSNLRELTIPDNYLSIPGDAFADCSALERIILCGDALAEDSAITGSIKWDGCAEGAEICVPAGTGEKYRSNKFWGERAEYVTECASTPSGTMLAAAAYIGGRRAFL